MTLTNYWWLLIWLFAGGIILNSLPKQKEVLGERTVDRWQPIAAILMVAPYIVWAGFRKDFGDTYVYQQGFRNATDNILEIPMLFFNDTKDPGYSAFLILMKSILGNHEEIYFIIIATVQLICIALVFRYYSDHYWTCIFLFVVSTDYLSWMHNGMRQFIAVAIIFAGFRFMVEKKYVPMIALIIFASLFHGSALLMIPIIFIVQGNVWNKKTVFLLGVAMVIVDYVEQFTPLLNDMLQETQYDDIMTNGIWETDDGTNLIRVLVYSMPAIFSLVGRKYLREINDPVINICCNCSIVTMALYLVASATSGIYIGRLPIYTTLYGYIALPWLIENVFEKRSAILIRMAMYVAYLGFFYYQMAIAWNAITAF